MQNPSLHSVITTFAQIFQVSLLEVSQEIYLHLGNKLLDLVLCNQYIRSHRHKEERCRLFYFISF